MIEWDMPSQPHMDADEQGLSADLLTIGQHRIGKRSVCRYLSFLRFHPLLVQINPYPSVVLLALLLAAGCRTARPLPPANLSEPGWTTHTGQAVWRRGRGKPEMAGEILVAERADGRAFVQFSKAAFPLMTAQSSPDVWDVEIPINNQRYSGRGKPPARLLLLWLPRALLGQALPRGWSWRQVENDAWQLANPSSGESLQVYFTQ